MVDLSRYGRQRVLAQVGDDGQRRLLRSRIAVIGAGALGCQSASLLARAGVGFIRVVDRDVVELDNLQRQGLYDECDIGRPKARAAEEKLVRVNSGIKVEGVMDDLNFSNALGLLRDVRVVVDGTDNMETRYLLNDACVKLGIPFVYGGAISTYGMTMAIVPKKTACFRCLFPSIPAPGSLPTCESQGVLNTVPALIASLQATETIKLLLGKAVNPNLVLYDAWTNELGEFRAKRNGQCPCCSKGRFEFLGAKRKEILSSLCGRNAVYINPLRKGTLDLKALAGRLGRLGTVKAGDSYLTFKTGSRELVVFENGKVMVRGTDDEGLAKSLYSRYVGD